MTHETEHVTQDGQSVLSIVSKFQIPSFMNQCINGKGLCRTAPATPDLLIANLQISPDFPAHQKKSGWLYIWVVVVVVCTRRLGTRTKMSETEVE